MSRFQALSPALAWAATIFVLSSFPGTAYPQTDLVNADKLVHVAIYALLGGLIGRGLARGWGLRGATLLALAAAASAVYGLTDELHQWFVPGRNASAWDVLADALGSLLGAAAMVLHAHLRGRGGARAHR